MVDTWVVTVLKSAVATFVVLGLFFPDWFLVVACFVDDVFGEYFSGFFECCCYVFVDDDLRLPSFSGHLICTDLVSVGEDVHCESTAQEVHAGVPA